jgi:alkanesulfonate monooxygenase SsuD/methylene tetrahydromethanopterin reductase-like flavin-dependent oxidoreductase (luciferase family)
LDRLLEGEIFLAGGPETVARAIRRARAELGIDLFLANVYAAGVDRDRVRRTMRLLAGPVRDALTATASACPTDATGMP